MKGDAMTTTTKKTFSLTEALALAKTLAEAWATEERMVPPGAVMRRAREAVAEALMQKGEAVADPVTIRTICREVTLRVADDGNRRDRERARSMLRAWGRP
jgi:hypothetical protein